MGCATLWIGDRLGPVERACLRSVLRQGHAVALYRYGDLQGVPEGVEERDARMVLPEDRIVRYPGGSAALFANWFRYELQRIGAETWIDTDQYLVAPLDGDRPYLFGYESPGWIAMGVLRLPPDSPLLAPLLALFEEKEVPPWLSAAEQEAARRRLDETGRTGLASMPWGTAGPKALTALAKEHGVDQWAYEPEVLYPVHFTDAEWILDPSRRLEDEITPATVGLHLWNERIKGFKDAPAPRGSFLARLHDEGA
jgi:hypothetical protein